MRSARNIGSPTVHLQARTSHVRTWAAGTGRAPIKYALWLCRRTFGRAIAIAGAQTRL